jgi:hypothetical protein
MTTYNMSGDRRYIATANGAALSTGVMTSVSIKLLAGTNVTKMSFASATTAAGTPTHWGFALYDTQATPAKVASSADQLTAAWAANTIKTLNMATPYVVQKSGWYWASIWVTATTVPTLLSAPAMTAGLLNTIGLNTGDVALAVTSGSGLTTAAPATIATPATSLVVPIAWVN